MFWKKNKVTHKLTLNFLLLFILLYLMIVGALYFGMTRVYEEKSLTKIELALGANYWLGWEQDVAKMYTSLEYIAMADGNYNVIYLLISPEDKIIASSNVEKSWIGEIANIYPQLFLLNSGEQFVSRGIDFKLVKQEIVTLGKIKNVHVLTFNVTNEKSEQRVRLSYLEFETGRKLIFAQFFADELFFFNSLVTISLQIFIIMLVIMSVSSYLLSRHAMKGVERVTNTALAIKKGDLDHRVPVGNEGVEIQNLANAFNDMLERISVVVQELTEVTNNIAHDLRSPITHIRGIAETTLLHESGLDSYRKMTATVIQESDRLINLVNILLDIAETDSGIQDLEKSKTDVQEILSLAHQLFLPVAEDKDIDLHLSVPANALYVLGNKSQLQRAIANLVDNAIKYTPAGGIVTIGADLVKDKVRICIVDNGIGISDENIEQIFKRFYRVDKSRSNNGNGLGLSLARSIINAHGGDISVKSELAKGSTFIVELLYCS